MASELDEYGIDRGEAADRLLTYVHQTLQDPDAQLRNLKLESGRWQAGLTDSRSGAETVFLHQHGGKIVGGHTSGGPRARLAPAPQGESSFRHQHQAEGEQDETRPAQGVPGSAEVEREELEQEAKVHFQTLKWHQPTRHRAAPRA